VLVLPDRAGWEDGRVTDLGELDAQIAAAAGDLQVHESLIHRIAELDLTLAGHGERVSELNARMHQEERDVERLEGLTIDSVLARLKGSFADDLQRQQAERDAIRYQLAEVQAQLHLVLRERERDNDRLAGHAGAARALEEALLAKERFLQDSGDAKAAELLALAEQRGRLVAETREIDEAISAAHDAVQALWVATERLGSAGSWSTYDTWFGGGVIGSIVKHDRLDQAQQAASYAESRLAVLRSELADVGVGRELASELSLDRTTRFVDIWFDNIITDLAVGHRISRAKETVGSAGRAVNSIAQRLHDRRADVVTRLDELDARREALLTGR
jgi:hypothetical protein